MNFNLRIELKIKFIKNYRLMSLNDNNEIINKNALD